MDKITPFIRFGLWASIAAIILFMGKKLTSLPRKLSWHPSSEKLSSPHFYSIDKKGRPYTVLSQTAFKASPSLYLFHDPKGLIKEENQPLITAKGNKGRYCNKTKSLEIIKEGIITVKNLYNFYTPYAKMDLKENHISSSYKVHGKGHFGTFYAQGFFLNSQRCILKGPVHLTITPPFCVKKKN